MTPKRRGIVVLSLVLVVYYLLAAWIFVGLEKHDIFFDSPQVDEKTNLEHADSILRGELSKELFWQEPGTFLYFAGLRVLGIDTPREIKFFQLFLLNPLVVFTIYLVGLQLTRRRFALAAAAVYALSPLPLFLATTLMKTTVTIFFYMLCFLFYFKFYQRRDRLLPGLAFALTWFVAWWTRQHILVFLPVFFLFLAGRKKDGSAVTALEKRNVMVVLVLVLVLLVSSLSLVSLTAGKQMLTLTSNGAVNFYIANNPDYEKTVAIWPGPEWKQLTHQVETGQIRPYAMVGEDPPGWLLLLAKKSLWEFTPYADFRQFYWGYYREIIPYFGLDLFLNLLLLPLVVVALVRFRELEAVYKAAALCWGIYHLVNIVLIPGIARYNAVILPIAIFLALEGGRRLGRSWRPLLVAVPLAVLLPFIHSPNDFKKEYYDYLGYVKKLDKREKGQVKIPPRTKHLVDWKYLQARYLFEVAGDFRGTVEAVRSVPGFARYGKYFVELLDFSLTKLDLYYDALLVHRRVRIPGYTEQRVKALQSAVVFKTEAMIDAYRREGRLSPQLANELAVYLVTLPPPDNMEIAQRLNTLLAIAADLAQEALREAAPAERRVYLDTLGIAYARQGLIEESRRVFRQVYDLIDDPAEKAKYRAARDIR